MPALTVEDTLDIMGPVGRLSSEGDAHEAEYIARTVQTLADGQPIYVRAIVDELTAMRDQGGADAMSALVALMAPEGRLCQACGYAYELRLHQRAATARLAPSSKFSLKKKGPLTEISARSARRDPPRLPVVAGRRRSDGSPEAATASPIRCALVRLHCRATV
jgi:hypothetical protein